jgi:uncharacterized coiled-coil protein SlyX
MELETLEAQLVQVEWRAAYYEMNIADLVRQIAELERQDGDSRHAMARLHKLTEMLSQEVAERNDLMQQLRSARASNAVSGFDI